MSDERKISMMPPFQLLLCQVIPGLFEGYTVMASNPFILWDRIEALVHSIPIKKYKDKLMPSTQSIRKELNRISATTLNITDNFNKQKTRSARQMSFLRNKLPYLYDLTFEVLGEAGWLTEIKGYGNVSKSEMDL